VASIQENIQAWGHHYSWPRAGDEWSDLWGGPEKQWSGTVLPRIQDFLPTGTILEIAPGFGRWTRFLKDNCEHLIGVDLNDNCIGECRRRFGAEKKLEFFLNDGKSLHMIPDSSVDFIFSFDSLVHAESDVIEAYIAQFPRIMKSTGAAFIHHSNYAAYRACNLVMKLSEMPLIRRLFYHTGLFGYRPNDQWRAVTVSALRFRSICQSHGLTCIRQELVGWLSDYLNDCFSTIVRSNSQADIVITENTSFMKEVAQIKG
jgi:ubiquinone/menaquinone biosynthesis C-methylase UbiE